MSASTSAQTAQASRETHPGNNLSQETAATLAARIPDGASLALPPDYSGCAVAVARELVRRRARGLHVISVPTAGFQTDVLIGAGCVKRLEAAAATLGEFGAAPRFAAALSAARIEMWDSTCPALHAGLQAAEKGVPFMPLRGIIGSDLLRIRKDWRVLQNPFAPTGTEDPIVVLPAIRPDVALFHAVAADRHGNVFIGVRRELMLMAHASRQTFVSVERIDDGDFLEDPARAAGTIPALYISAVAVVPGGAAPVGLVGATKPDRAALAAYVNVAKTDVGFAQWLTQWLADDAASGEVSSLDRRQP